MQTTDIITAAVAIYGAALSTFTFWNQRNETRRRVKVTLKWGLFGYPTGDSGGPYFFIEAANIGHVPVTLSSHGIFLPGDHFLVTPYPLSNVSFPYELAPGQSCSIWIDVHEVAQSMHRHGYSGKVKLVGFYRDQTGKDFKSDPLEFTMDEFL